MYLDKACNHCSYVLIFWYKEFKLGGFLLCVAVQNDRGIMENRLITKSECVTDGTRTLCLTVMTTMMTAQVSVPAAMNTLCRWSRWMDMGICRSSWLSLLLDRALGIASNTNSSAHTQRLW